MASAEGFGPLRVGRTTAELRRLGIEVVWECGGGSIGPRGPRNVVAVTDVDGRIVRIDIDVGAEGQLRLRAVRTDAGVQLGDPASRLEAAYEGRRLVELRSEDPEVERELMYVAPSGRVIVYTISGGRVTHIRLGERASAEPSAPCE